jgi:NAD-dependent deacetylase
MKFLVMRFMTTWLDRVVKKLLHSPLRGMKRFYRSANYRSVLNAPERGAPTFCNVKIAAQFERISKRLDDAEEIVLVTGAGVSADSGIPTFRDGMTGLWNNVNPDQVANIQGFLDDPDRVWQWHAALKTLIDQKRPNHGHDAIAEFERMFFGKRFTVITQNIDGYHAKVGNSRVFEIHGSIHRLRCFRHCGFLQYWEDANTYPIKCPSCGAATRPDVVWFGEPLNEDLFAFAEAAVLNADIVFSVGTSLTVHPVARFPQMAKDSGALVVEINPFETPFSSIADISFRHGAGEFFPQLLRHITNARKG